MPQITSNICLDVSLSDAGQSLMAKRGDVGSRRICVRFTDCGKPIAIENDATVLLNIARGEEKRSFAGTVDSEGCALFVLPAFALETAGELICGVTAVNAEGERLSTASFTLTVEDVILAEAADLGDGAEDLLREWIASETYTQLPVYASPDGVDLFPETNRKYDLELLHKVCCVDGAWKEVFLRLPQPTDYSRDAWVMISCYTPIHPTAGAVKFNWDGARFLYGVAPDICCEYFDIICIYSHMTGFWRIGVLQYGRGEGSI